LDDDFFLLGGDSLGTVEIATWAAEQYQISIEISCLFDYSTIGSLPEHIRELIEDCSKSFEICIIHSLSVLTGPEML
jgi:hypothetical protein